MPPERIPYELPRQSHETMRRTADEMLDRMARRRSCRDFSPEPVPRDLIRRAVAVAHSAPSGANRRPWRFVAIDDPALKRAVREAAETEERENYEHRFTEEWLEALEPLGTDASKPFLETAPWLIALFRIDWEDHGGYRRKNYYPMESACLAAGFFLWACHRMGLATLTHTPSPMVFLREILGRGPNEKPILLIPVGYPAPGCTVPAIDRKPLEDALQWNLGGGGGTAAG